MMTYTGLFSYFFGRVAKNQPSILLKVDHFCHQPYSQKKKKSMVS